MRTKWRVIGGVLLLAILVFGAVGWAGTIQVDVNGAGCVGTSGQPDPYSVVYCSIQDAIDDASPGDIINVAAGTYDEQVVIDKALMLQGAGDTTIIKPSQTTASGFQTFTRFGGGSTAGIVVANANGADVTVKALKVDGELVTSTPSSAGLVGIFYRETGGTIDNVTVEDITVETGNGMYLSAVSETVSVEVKNSTFTNYQKNGINANGGTLTANIHDNTVTGRGLLGDGDHCQNGIQLWDSEGTITGNTVSDHFYTPTSGTDYAATGIFLNEAKSSTVSGNTLTNNEEGVALDYYTAGSGSGVTINVNGGTITGGTYGIRISNPYDTSLGCDLTCNVAAVTVDGASYAGIMIYRNVNLTLSNSTIKNTGSGGYAGIYIAYDQCSVTIDDNTIQSNGGYGIMSWGLDTGTPTVLTITGNTITGSPTGIGSYLSTTTAHFNNIYGNTNYGVENWDATVLDAENNWWGDASGPYATTNTSGLGNAVSDNVDYDPWIGAEAGETESETVTGSGTVTDTPTGGDVTIDATGDHTITTAKYASNPGGTTSFSAAGNYYDVHLDGVADVNSLTVQFCPATASTIIYYWNGTSWQRASDQTYADGCIVVTITNSTSPCLEDLSGLPFAGSEVTLGDINDDGYVNVLDARLCLQIATGFITSTVAQEAAADVDGDGDVDLDDAELLAKYIIGMEDKLGGD